jgi:membrane-associated phospholipid phosphatase
LASYKHFLATLSLIPVFIWFRFEEQFLTPLYYIKIPLDDYIPLLPIFVIPYLLWFAYVTWGILYTGLHSKMDFYKLIIFLGVGMSLAYTLYMIFPNAQNLRPEITRSDIFSRLLVLIYTFDTATNVCPSVHVINAYAVHAALIHTRPFCTRRINRYGSFILFILICASTVFTKQHSAFDVICGLLFGTLLYIPLYKLFRFKLNEPLDRLDGGAHG